MRKPLTELKGEVAYGSELFRWLIEAVVRIFGRWSTALNSVIRLVTMKQLVEPTLMITSWNFPLVMGTRRVGPVITAGCTMLLKPSLTC